MRSNRQLTACLCTVLLLPASVFGQQPAPSSAGSAPASGIRWDQKWFSKPYVEHQIAPINLRNSNRADQLIRAGNIYLSLADAIALALENNLDIELSRYGPQLAQADLKRAEAGGFIRGVPLNVTAGPNSAAAFVTGGFGGGTGGSGTGAGNAGGAGGAQSGTVFQVTGVQIPTLDPSINFGYTFGKTTNPQTNTFVSGTTALIVRQNGFNTGYSQQFLTGTGFQFNWSQNRIETNSPNNDLNPFFRGNFNLQLTQRLLQGWGVAVNNRNIRISRNNLKVSDLVFKQQVITTVAAVINLYLDLVSFNEDLKVRERAVGLAQKLYDDNKKQVEIGTLAPIEVVRAEAQLAQAKTDQIVSETRVLQQETIIKNALSRTGIASPTWQDARIIPTDRFTLPTDDALSSLNELTDLALKNRPEMEQTRISITNTKIGLAGAKSQLRPSLDVFASATNNALTGQVNDVPFPPGRPQIIRTPDPFVVGGVGNFYGQIFRRNFPDHTVGFQLNVPIRNRAAQADIANDTLRLRQQELQEQRLENDIRVQVQQAVIALRQAKANYDSAIKARELQERTLDAEQKKFALGSSTIFVVVQTQRDLVNAQSVEVGAINNYFRAKNQLDVALGRVLETNSVDISEAVKGEVGRPASRIQ